jgi:hypothetical protein
MLTTAVVMSVGAEQTSVRPVSSDRVEIEGMSFAKSFDERIALAVGAEAKTAADKGAAALRDVTSGVALNISDEVVAVPDAGKGKAIAGQVAASGPGDGKSAAVAKSPDVAVIVAGGLQAKATFEKVPTEVGGIRNTTVTKDVDASKTVLGGSQGKSIAGSVSAVQDALPAGKVDTVAGDLPRVQKDVPPVGVTHVAPMPQVRVAAPDRPVVPGGGQGHVVQQEIEIAGAGKPETVAPVKKAAKSQESKTASKVALKPAGAADHVTATVTQAPGGMAAQTGVPVPVAVIALTPAQQNEIGKTPEGSSGEVVSAVAGRSAGVAVAATEGKDGKEGARSGKAPVEDSEPAVTAAGDVIASQKSGSESSKTVSSAISAGADGDGKMQSATVGLVHAPAGPTGAVSGLVAGVASGHVAGDVTAAKLQSGEASAHASALHAGSGEQDGSGVTAAPVMDGAHRTLTATPTALEIGIANGTHGWLKIRAEMTGGGVVNASLSAASPAGQEMLHRELPSLTAYLQQEQVAVNTVVVHAAVAGAESRDLSGGMNGEGSGQTQQRNSQGGEARQGTVSAGPNHTEEAVIYEGLNGVGADGLLSPASYAGGGSWLSVRA